MKYLISFNTSIVNQEQASEWGVDKVLILGSDLSTELLNIPQENQLVFYVPTTLDYGNSLSYGGANLGLRILMKYIGTGRTDIDVVLMGNESEANFLLHYDYPNILKIPGMHYIRFNKKYVATYNVPPRNQLHCDEYKTYLDNLGLKIPSSFKSTHSLTNEWCFFKWNSFMGFNEDLSSLEGHIYFEYLITIEKLNKLSYKPITDYLKERISNFPTARILLIDDKEGWHTFFKKMFANAENVDVRCIGKNFNKQEFYDIKSSIENEISDFNPNIIILDYRLMEDADAEVKDNMKKISGYQVLSKVLKGTYKNPLDSFGRQVIIFTATSRIENILLLREGNADGFILKEKPQNYNGKEITKNVISKMLTTLETAVYRANFLIPLNEKLDKIEGLMPLQKYSDKLKLKNEIVATTESIRLITQNNEIDDVLKLVYLNIYKIFESIHKDSGIVNFPNDFSLTILANSVLKVCSKGKSSIYKKSGDDWNCIHKSVLSSEHERYCKDRSLNFAMCAIILFRLGHSQVDDTKWNDIRIIRNALAHGESEQLYKRKLNLSPDTLKQYILEMLDLLEQILNPMCINEVVPALLN